MVSLWPWKADDTTSAFEKTLSALSAKITKANITRESLRSRSRRLKALWTLYTTLTYIFCTAILLLVTGWANWNITEYGAVLGSPFLIYGVRFALATYYNYRLSKTQSYLNELTKQRETAVEKFKTATKYNTTQQLLEKYGAAPQSTTTSRASPYSANKNQSDSNDGTPRLRPNRTNLPPPPTANIRRPEGPIPISESPRQPYPGQVLGRPQISSPAVPQDASLTEEFAPNAFTAPPQYSSSPAYGSSHRHKWYDRILDVVLGEDESRPINRLALICHQCRLVNGQAPPGVKTLEELGKWRCSGCGAMNGEDSEAKKIIEAASSRHESVLSDANEQLHQENRQKIPEMAQKSKIDGAFDGVGETSSILNDDVSSTISDSEANTEVAEDLSDDDSIHDTPPPRSTRSQAGRTKRI